MKITKVYQCWEYQAKKCLAPFIDSVVRARQAADKGVGSDLQAEQAKLVGNSMYGGTILNKDKYTSVLYTKSILKVCSEINRPTFSSASGMGEDAYEVQSVAKKILQNVPIQLGHFILNLAKKHMVTFFHLIIAKHCDMSKIALTSMDTDSLGFALAEKDIDSCVRPVMREKWDNVIKPKWFVHDGCGDKCDLDTCNKRVPGPFKMEFEGEECIGLAPKLLIVGAGNLGQKNKMPTKGLVKASMAHDSVNKFKETLHGKAKINVPFGGMNIRDNSVVRVDSARVVSGENYSKRRVDSADCTKTHAPQHTVYCGEALKEVGNTVHRGRISKVGDGESLPVYSQTDPIDLDTMPPTPMPPYSDFGSDSDSDNDPQPSTSTHLSPAKRQRMEKNRLEALGKRKSKVMSPSMKRRIEQKRKDALQKRRSNRSKELNVNLFPESSSLSFPFNGSNFMDKYLH